ncbi:MAG: hypothetical protein M1480_04520 [Bacteroidetes bacterium]|nr:hypothetical protein [Bacteroidota bacterium]
MRSKRKSEIIHIKRRFNERFELDFSNQDIENISKIIQSNRSKKKKFIKRISNRVTVFQIEYKDNSITVLYDKNTKMPITVLPKGNYIERTVLKEEM